MQDQLYVQVCEDSRAAAARSQIYKTLSGLFTYPADETCQQFVLLDAALALQEAAPDLPYAVPAMAALEMPSGERPDEAANDAKDLALTYTRLFDNCGGRPLLSLHEKDHAGRDPQMIWEDLIRFYEYFGIRYHLGVNKVWPDWIGMEFEFMHYLSFLEAGAESAHSYIAAQADFLERHLGAWIPAFADRLATKAAGTPYAHFADVLKAFIQADCEFNRARRPVKQAA